MFVVGILLILSVLVPNLAGSIQAAWKRRRAQTTAAAKTVTA